MNVLTGLPRAGTTLISNILNQNNQISVSSTSVLCEIMLNISNVLSNSSEVTSDLISKNDHVGTLKNSMVSFCDSYKNTDKIYFNKSRGWASANLLLTYLYNNSVSIVCVRDPRDVFASIEKQHGSTALFSDSISLNIREKMHDMFSNDGFIGSPIRGVVDLHNRKQGNAIFVKYEDFCLEPIFFIKKIYNALGIECYNHDFDNVKNVSSDVDELYRGKFPHIGSGKVGSKDSTWKNYLSEEIGEEIINLCPQYSNLFGYR